MPVGLGYRYNQPWASARLLSLGADFQLAKDLMNILLADISNGAVNCVEATDALGDKCVIFLDHVSRIANFSALAVLTMQ